MDRNERRPISEYTADHLDVSSMRMADDISAFLKDFVDGYDDTRQSPEGQPQMGYNPFETRLREVKEDIKGLELRRAELADLLAWANRFNLDERVDEIARLKGDLIVHLKAGFEKGTGALERLEVDIRELEAGAPVLSYETPELDNDVCLGSRVRRLFASEDEGVKAWLDAIRTERLQAKSRLASHTKELQRVRNRLQDTVEARGHLNSEIAEVTDSLAKRERALDRFRGFVPSEVEETLAEVDGELSRLQEERAQLEPRAMDVDSAVEAPLKILRKYEVEIEELESETAKLQTELSQLQGQADEIDRISKDLSRAGTTYERAMLHQECEREFGHGKPGEASREIRRQMGPLQKKVAEHQHKVRQLRRDMAKTEERITDLVAIATRDINALIIDGNNCCYQGGDFIGLAALNPMTASLADRFAVTVVFDASILQLLGVGDDYFRSALPSASAYVVAPGVKADETILDTAHEPTTWVISNDRFGEFRDKAPVQGGRVIRHQILADRVLVHDLDVNEPLLEP